MSIKKSQFFYDKQIENYILQFMAIFSGLQVKLGTNESIPVTSTTTECGLEIIGEDVDSNYPKNLINVPIHHGFKDRIVASILSDNVQNTPLRLPLMSAVLRNIRLSPELYAGKGSTQRNSYTPIGGLLPDDVKVIHREKALPYTLQFELNIYSSNLNHFYQMLEQILVLFDPDLQIQTTDKAFDWKKITSVKLTDINFDINYPSLTDRRIIIAVLSFDVIAYLGVPDKINNDFIKDIYLRLGVVSDLNQSKYDLLSKLDSENIPYQLIVSGDQLPFE